MTKNLLNSLLLACACGRGGRQLEAPESCINPMLSPHCKNKGCSMDESEAESQALSPFIRWELGGVLGASCSHISVKKVAAQHT